MHIKVIAVNLEQATSAKGTPYTTAEVTYKNMTYGGKTETKKVMPFGATKSAYEVVSNAAPGEEYTITVVKNDRGYNDWVSASPGLVGEAAPAKPAAAAPVQSRSGGNVGGGTTAGRDWETAEERAKKQIYIVRQSSVSNAIELLSVGQKAPPSVEDVIKVAKEFEAYVFGDSSELSKPAASLSDMDDDIPFN